MLTPTSVKTHSDPPFAFSEGTFERASERRENAGWIESLHADPRARVIAVAADGRVGLTPDGNLLARKHLHTLDQETIRQTSLLGFEDDIPLFAHEVHDVAPDAASHLDLRAIAATLPAREAGIAAYARALLYWQARTKFCGRCGARLNLVAAGHRAVCSAEACGDAFFPRTDPAVIVLVEHDGRALLGRQASWGEGRFSTLAGFVEPGEALEDAVRREIFEESGIRIGAVRYQASQPWPFPSSLMIGFRADALTDEIEVGDEIVEARWFSPEDIDRERVAGTLKISPRLSISRWLLGEWYRERSGRELLD